MKKVYFVLPVIAAFLGVRTHIGFTAEGPHSGKKILIAYFSHSGNTREIANQIHKLAGGDIFEIKTVTPYPEDYDAVVAQARKEVASDYRPELKTKIDVKPYDVVFIGYPNWCSTVPAPVKTFLAGHDFSGKTVAPFCTHGGGGLGNSVEDISKLCPKAAVTEALAVSGSTVRTAQGKVSEWLKKIKIAK
jgi:flavodoxin